MSEPTQDQDKTQIVPKREVRVVVDDSTQGYLFDTARFEHAMRIAGAMASANLIPKHLREDKNGEFHPDTIRANCFIIVNQAIRWGFDPFSLLKECYVVGGVLGWQGKLVCAVINARAGLKQNLDFTFTGKKGTPEYEVTVHGTFKGEDKERIVTLTVAEAKTANDIWVRDPEQKLCYSGAIKWSRRHAPEIVLGVLTEDDVDKIAADKAKPITAKVVEKPVFAVEDKKVPMQPHEHLVKSDAEDRGRENHAALPRLQRGGQMTSDSPDIYLTGYPELCRGEPWAEYRPGSTSSLSRRPMTTSRPELHRHQEVAPAPIHAVSLQILARQPVG